MHRKDNSTALAGAIAASATDLECSDADRAKVEKAAMWLAEQTDKPSPLIPYLRSTFDLTTKQACEATGLAQRFKVNRRAFG